MAVAGVPRPAPGDAARLARMALRMQAAADETAAEFGVTLRLRIGIALGPVMAGVIGTERFSYDVWGDAVNLAARLESTGEPGRIQVSQRFARSADGGLRLHPPRNDGDQGRRAGGHVVFDGGDGKSGMIPDTRFPQAARPLSCRSK